MLTILIACDHKSSRESLIALLSAQPGFNIIGVCADTHTAIAITGREQPDIVLIDGSTDPLAIIEAIKKIRTCSTAGVIALSRQADRGFARLMMAAGALGYLTGNCSDIEVITAVREVAKDNCYCCLETKHLSIATVLDSNPAFQVIASCKDSLEAIEITVIEKPDIILMDIDIPPISGIEATRKICTASPSRVIGLSMHLQSCYVKNIMRAGALGYVIKKSSKDEMLAAITEVNKGNKFICKEMKTLLSEELLRGSLAAPHIGMLSRREMEIVNYIKDGLSSKEIACSMQIALKTVDVHRHNILKKLQWRNASCLVNFMHNRREYVFGNDKKR
jgi:DNA-binding NarL/FixJ family response regulator